MPTDMTSHAFVALDRRQGRREIVGTLINAMLAFGLVVGIYYLIPLDDLTSGQAVLRLVAGIIAFALILLWQLRHVARAAFPGFGRCALSPHRSRCSWWCSLPSISPSARGSGTQFSEPLDHTGAPVSRDHGLLHGGVWRHHAGERPGTHRRQHSDAARPGGRRRCRSPHRHRRQVRNQDQVHTGRRREVTGSLRTNLHRLEDRADL